MSGTKFTKGPWFVGNYNNLRSSEQDKHSSICVNVSMTLANDEQNSEYTANAHLIAAAPAMYAMLNKLTQPYGMEDFSHDEVEQLLAKARGEK